MIKDFVLLNRRAAAHLQRILPGVFDAPSCVSELKERIYRSIESNGPRKILEVGGVDRPLLFRSPDYTYFGVDIDDRPECSGLYDEFIVQSVEHPMQVKTDMIISITLLEHIPNNAAAVSSMYQSLSPGGVTHHYIPSKWHPYSIALRMVGPKLQKKLIATLRPAAQEVTGYPVFFDHCSPAAMQALFSRAGFKNIEVKSFYRANDYFAFFIPAYLLVTAFENICSLMNLTFFASGFVISAHRPLTEKPTL